MKKIIRYLPHGRVQPYFVEDGGFFPVGNKCIGVSCDDTLCYLPTTVVVLTNAELVTYVEGQTILDADLTELTLAEKTTAANDWLTAKGF